MKKRLVMFLLFFVLFIGNVHAYYMPEQGRWLNRDPLEERGHMTVSQVAEQQAIGKIPVRNLADKIFQPIQLVSQSSLKKNLNLYSFVNNRPINAYDPLGLITIGFPGFGPEGLNTSNSVFNQGVENRGGTIYNRSGPGLRQAIRNIENAWKEKCEEVNIYGYSRGAYVALILASELDSKHIPIDLLFTIDPVLFWPVDNFRFLNVPSNVKMAENHYQSGKILGPTDFSGRPLSGENVNNIPYEDIEIKGYPVQHENMPSIVFGL
jgi:hypothetical protein